mmetsp:Transcript_61246/g.145797  ORF Transcript_61246/g.145797 Transcript_61246/m.145797 type:complete len:760 (+) Transcript_61246:58-2337(+)
MNGVSSLKPVAAVSAVELQHVDDALQALKLSASSILAAERQLRLVLNDSRQHRIIATPSSDAGVPRSKSPDDSLKANSTSLSPFISGSKPRTKLEVSVGDSDVAEFTGAPEPLIDMVLDLDAVGHESLTAPVLRASPSGASAGPSPSDLPSSRQRFAAGSEGRTKGLSWSKSHLGQSTFTGVLQPRLHDMFAELGIMDGAASATSYLREDVLVDSSVAPILRGARTGTLQFEADSRLQWLVMRPASIKRLTWDALSTMVLLYDLFLVPYAAFDPPITRASVHIDWMTTAFWLLDMFASCLTGFYSDGVVEMRIGVITRKYLRSWRMPIEFTAVCADLLIIILGTGTHLTSVLRLGKSARLTRGLRFLRLARLNKLLKKWNELFDTVQSEVARCLLSIGTLLASLVILNHYIACAWFTLAKENFAGASRTWMSEHDASDDTRLYWYTTSLHWAFTQCTPASMEVHATNAAERIFSVFVLFFGFVCFGSFLSSITTSMTILGQMQVESKKQESALRKYFLRNDISADLGNCITKFFQARRQSKAKLRYEEADMPLLQALPERLRVLLHEELYAHSLVHHPFFEQYGHICRFGLTELCHQAVSMRHVSSGEIVFYECEVAESMFFITCGTMDFSRTDSNEKINLATNDWCTEQALWLHWTHRGRLIGGDNSECIAVNGEACRKVLLSEYHARGREAVISYAKLFAEYVFSLDANQLSDVFGDEIFPIEALAQGMRGVSGQQSRDTKLTRSLNVAALSPFRGS